jgi:hypothetical protein
MNRYTKAQWLVAVFIIACVIVLFFTGCTSRPTTGYVKEKQYVPAHWEGAMRQRMTGMTCTPNGKNGTTCTPTYTTYWEDQDHWEEQSWELRLENCYSQDGCRDGWVRVTEEAYGRYDVGQHYPNPR